MILARSKITTTMIPEVVGIDRYYMLRDQSLPKPVVPTTNPPEEAAWVKTEPEYVEGSTNNLYTVDNVLYSDDTFQYSQVSLASSYTAAKQAYILAKENEKHFFFDTDGAHITHGEHTPNTGKNMLMTNEGIKIRQDTNVLAEFGANQAMVGEQTRSHVQISPDTTVFYNVDGYTPTAIINNSALSSFVHEDTIVSETSSGTDLNYLSNTTASAVLSITPVDIGSAYPLLTVETIIQTYDYIYGPSGHEGGYWRTAYRERIIFNDSGSEKLSTMPISIAFDKATKTVTVTYGDMSELNGLTNTPQINIISEYYTGEPSARYSFGINALASGDYAFANGYSTNAAGMYSHASGQGTTANGTAQTVVGKYNSANTTDLFIVGKGNSDSSRSNAFGVSAEGNVYAAGSGNFPNGVTKTESSAWGNGYDTNMYGRLVTESEAFTGRHEIKPRNNAALQVTEYSNLDDYINPGCHYCASGTVAKTLTHSPFSDSSYMMIVFKLAYNSSKQLIQIAWQNKENSFMKFRIRTDTGAWGDWYSLARGAGDLSSYLTTTAAANTYARKDTVGTIVYKSLSADKSIAAGSSQKNMASISCAAGIWSVTAHAAFQPGGTVGHYRAVSIGSSATNATYGTFQCGSSNGSTVIQTSRHITLTSTTTLYLNVYSQDAITVNAGSTIIEAVRLR